MEEKLHIRKIIARNIRKYRKLNNLTQEKLAELADISNTYIANIECGQTWISDKTVEKIATALHVDAYVLFIPEIDNEKIVEKIDRRQELISYLSSRKKALENYIDDFFSETLDYILQKK